MELRLDLKFGICLYIKSIDTSQIRFIQKKQGK